MAVGSNQYTVSTAAVLVAAVPASQGSSGAVSSVYLANTGAVTVYLGGVNVSSSNGAAVAANGTLTLSLFSGDQLYAVTASSSSTLTVLQT